jgi:predicted nucleic acid-binding protein
MEVIRQRFPLLSDSPEILDQWRQLVEALPIKGKRAHDARLVAVMKVYGISHLLTFNTGDFEFYRELTLIHPAELSVVGGEQGTMV